MAGFLAKVSNLAASQLTKPQPIAAASTIFKKPQITAFSTQAASQKFETPEQYDVCIIGGGAMGSSTAFWLKHRPEGKNLRVCVIERDDKYTTASTVLSLGGIRQQFSNGENVQLSLFGSEFIRNIQGYLGVEGQSPVDIQFRPGGYLLVATTPEGANVLQENHKVQRQYDSKVELLTRNTLKARYPFMNVDDIELASVGVENEGWFDPWSLLNGFRKKAISLGVQYVCGEVVGFESPNEHIGCGPTQLHVKNSKGETKSIKFSQCVVATGYESGKVSRLAGIGAGKGMLSVGIPVEAKKRYVYFIHTPEFKEYVNVSGFEPNGVYYRPEGSPGNFFTGRSPEEDDEPSCENLDVDYSFFENEVWPTLAHRVKAFENIKIKSAWGGYYDYNTFDQNGIIGQHPVFKNFYFATGFSGHGIQQSPAVGRAIMELILDGSFKTIDLKRFGFERLVRQERILERNCF